MKGPNRVLCLSWIKNYHLIFQATGLTGLKVVESPHKTLAVIYDKILRTCEKMPEEAVYRKSVTAQTQERLNIVKSVSSNRCRIFLASWSHWSSAICLILFPKNIAINYLIIIFRITLLLELRRKLTVAKRRKLYCRYTKFKK